jgi:hypothetical protein
MIHPNEAAAMYDCLRQCRPFNRWKLPEAEGIEFVVVNDPRIYAEFVVKYNDGIKIKISGASLSHFNTLAMYMAHEMVHLAQEIAKTHTGANRPKNPLSGHNADFKRRAALVCKRWGWDPKTFF